MTADKACRPGLGLHRPVPYPRRGPRAAQDGGDHGGEAAVPPATTPSPARASPQGRPSRRTSLGRPVGERPARPARLPPDDEITPTATDEGAGWEAAVEAAQARRL